MDRWLVSFESSEELRTAEAYCALRSSGYILPHQELKWGTSRLPRCVCSSGFFGSARQGRMCTCSVWGASPRVIVPSAADIGGMCSTYSCSAPTWRPCGRSLLSAFASPHGGPNDTCGQARRTPPGYAVVAPQHGGPLHPLGGLEIQKLYGVRP
jgi:hypothetical protein